MPQINIRPTIRRRNDTTILAENFGKLRFDTTETVLSNTPTTERESTQKYLEFIGAANFDKQFNDVVSQYEEQFKLQSIELQKQANLAQQDTMMQAGENILPNLGAGAAADLAGDIETAQKQQSQAAQVELTEQFTEAVTDIQKLYQEHLLETFGELTPDGYANLTEYDAMIESFSMAMLEQVAQNVNLTYSNDTQLMTQLRDQGYIQQVGMTDEFELTEKGWQQFKSVLIDLSASYGDTDSTNRINDLVSTWSERYMSTTYPSLDPESDTYKNKQADVEQRYNEWMQQNMPAAYYTHLDLARFMDGRFEVEGINYTTLPQADTSISSTSVNVQNITEDWFGEFFDSGKEGTEQYKYINAIISDLKAGTVPDGSYFVANYGAALKTKEFFYYENGFVYKTEFTVKDLPPKFSADSMYEKSAADSRITDAKDGRLASGDYYLGNMQKYHYDATTKMFTKIK